MASNSMNYTTRLSSKDHYLLTSLKQKTGYSFINIIDYSLGIKSISNNELNNYIPSIGPKVIRSSVDFKPLISKPSSFLIDSFILIPWKYYPNECIKSRQTIFDLVRCKFSTGFFPGFEHITFPVIDNQCWSEIYTKWFKNNLYRQSNFNVFLDNRLKFLLTNGFILRVEPGMYKLNVNFSDEEWELIESISKLPPQDGLKIPYLLKSPKGKAWPLVHNDIFVSKDINEQVQ